MKVIFLDFDGVINNWYTFESVNEENLLNLKKIVDETNAKIVVTSSSKYVFQRKINQVEYEESRCYKIYVKALLTIGIEVYDFTPYINGDRRKEILEYLRLHPEIKEYLIFTK